LARSVPLSRFTSRVGGGSAFFVRPRGCVSPEIYAEKKSRVFYQVGHSFHCSRYFCHFCCGERSSYFVVSRSTLAVALFCFAGSDVGERELPGDFSAEYFVGYFYEDSRIVA